MSNLATFCTLNELKCESMTDWIFPEAIDKINNETKDYRTRLEKVITHVAVGVIGGCFTVTCILQGTNRKDKELEEGKYSVYSYNLDNSTQSRFEKCIIKMTWDGVLCREEEQSPKFIETGKLENIETVNHIRYFEQFM